MTAQAQADLDALREWDREEHEVMAEWSRPDSAAGWPDVAAGLDALRASHSWASSASAYVGLSDDGEYFAGAHVEGEQVDEVDVTAATFEGAMGELVAQLRACVADRPCAPCYEDRRNCECPSGCDCPGGRGAMAPAVPS